MKPRPLYLLVCQIDKSHLELVNWESMPVTLSTEEIGRIEFLGLDAVLFSTIETKVILSPKREIPHPKPLITEIVCAV
jgi:hypothetical protein